LIWCFALRYGLRFTQTMVEWRVGVILCSTRLPNDAALVKTARGFDLTVKDAPQRLFSRLPKLGRRQTMAICRPDHGPSSR
jgi:hypothetical protein